MTPYWIKTDRGLGVGLTALSEAGARALFDEVFGSSYKFMGIEPIADMRHLDQNHVVPNMGNWLRRGVWFPLGHAQISN